MTNEEAVKGVMKIWTGYITAYAEVSHEDVEAFSMAIEALKKLKRYEPETVTNCHDLISKRDVYLALVEKGQASKRYKLGETWELNGKEIREVLDALPSAQPERTCVNCGRTANNGGWYADGRTRCPIEEHYALPKDGYCHLWEKRNVTDDDYPERRTDE